jgi:hypothetical protein
MLLYVNIRIIFFEFCTFSFFKNSNKSVKINFLKIFFNEWGFRSDTKEEVKIYVVPFTCLIPKNEKKNGNG